MACPYFVPTRKSETVAWLHPARLPMGAGFEGHCGAPGHEGCIPTGDELRDFCNLGYAAGCVRLPQDRICDAVRFSVARESRSQVLFWFVCESGHRPVDHGKLEFDLDRRRWTAPHRDPRIQTLAECYLQTYLQRQPLSLAALSENP